MRYSYNSTNHCVSVPSDSCLKLRIYSKKGIGE